MISSRSVLLFSLEVTAIAAYVWHQIAVLFMNGEKFRIFPSILLLPVFILLGAAFLKKTAGWSAGKLARMTGLPYIRISHCLVLALSPFLILYLDFLQYIVFLKDIRGYLLPLSLLGSGYLLFVSLSRLKRAYPDAVAVPHFLRALNPNRLPSKRLPLFVFFLALTVYVIYAAGLLFPPQPFTGDEPHYLLITQSILKDGDINLFNNYEEKDYLEYYPGDLRSHAFRGKKGDRYQYSKHLPALSLLVLPAYCCGKTAARLGKSLTDKPGAERRIIVFFARLPLCILTAMAGLMLFLIVRDLTQREDAALSGWFLFSFTAPVLFYSHLVYPEIPAALITMFLIRCLLLRKGLKASCLFLSGLGIALLPWFGIKYVALSALLSLVSVFALFISKMEKKWGRLLCWAAPPILSAILYMYFLWSLYGSFSPSSVYKGVIPDASTPAWLNHFFKSGSIEFFSRLLGYFGDQRFGVFFYAPVYVLGLAGLFFFWKRRKKMASGLLFIFAAFAAFSAYYYWGGYCPPARPLIPVMWIWALFTAFSFTVFQSPSRLAIKRSVIAVSVVATWAALNNPWILYHENTSSGLFEDAAGSRLLVDSSNSFVDLVKIFPLLGREARGWIPLLFWTAAVIGVSIFFIKKAGGRKHGSLSLNITVHLISVFSLSLIVLAYAFFDIRLNRKDAFQGQGYELYFQDANHYGHELGGFWTRGKRETAAVLKTSRPPSRIDLSLTGRVEGITEVQVGRVSKTAERTGEAGMQTEISFPSPTGFPLRGSRLYCISIQESSAFIPFRLDKKERDNRSLGVFVRITVQFRNPP